MEVSVIIPNFNGIAFLDSVLGRLEGQTLKNFEVILGDNGSADGSCSFVSANYPWVHIIELPDNFGFCRAVNEGIKAAKAPYVLLLNNDTEVKEDFVEQMLLAIRRHKNAFSCAARMVQYHDRDKLDDAGNYYCALGWSFARGKGKNIDLYQKEEKIFSACGGAAIYRKKIMEKIGYFDEEHFAYLEDTDIGYRARIYGYENWYAPDAVVYHVGSGTSGSRYNHFKTRYSSRNNIYLIYKNMPLLQIILNLPFLAAGFLIKFLFFALKGMGKEYLAGIKNGFSISMNHRKVPFSVKHLPNYCKIQLELWENMYMDSLLIPRGREKEYWDDNLERVPKNLDRGFIDSNKIPNKESFKRVKQINQMLYLILYKLGEYYNIRNKKASVRVYKNEECFQKQLMLNTKYIISCDRKQ